MTDISSRGCIFSSETYTFPTQPQKPLKIASFGQNIQKPILILGTLYKVHSSTLWIGSKHRRRQAVQRHRAGESSLSLKEKL